MKNNVSIAPAGATQRAAIMQLLRAENLPADDLPFSLDSFFVASDGDEIVGAIGLEIYGKDALLRSMVVAPGYRGCGVAARLVREAEELGHSLGLSGIYLLTLTAESYFEKKGYELLRREDAPVELCRSAEFMHSCPATARLMRKFF